MRRIVLFMGIDGSGKSTLSAMVKQELDRRGIRCKSVWASHRPYLMKPFIVAAKFLLVRKHDKFKDYSKHIEAKRAGMRRLAWLRPLYFLVTVIDYLPQVFFKVYLPALTGTVVICDRYYQDLVLDFGVTSVLPIQRTLRLLAWADRVLPRPDLHYWVDVPVEVAMARKDDIPSVDYLSERAEIYRHFAAQMGSVIIDGTAVLHANRDRIVAEIEALAAAGPEPA